MRFVKIAFAGLVLTASTILGAANDSVVIRNVTIHPITAPDIPNGAVLVIDGKIAEVGPKVGGRAGARVVDGRGLQLYPGLINAATNVGLEEIEAIRDSVDLDEIGMFNPDVRAEVAWNPSSEHIEVTRAAGITTVISLPGSGARSFRGGPGTVISGQGALMHLEGWTWEEAAVKPSAVMDMVFPQVQTIPRQFAAFLGQPNRSYQEEERQYREHLRQISEFFEDARRYERAKAAPGPDFRRDIRLEAMIPVIEGKTAFAGARRTGADD